MNTWIDAKKHRPSTHNRASPERVLRHIDWHVVRPLDGILQGDYRSLFYGSGLDLADLREYQVGDDIRSIDWNVTARMNAPYVRQYLEDREISAWFLMDFSPSMAFGAGERYKDSILIDFVATMARLLTRNGNRVGAMFYNNRIELTIPPRGGRNQVLRMINDMQNREISRSDSMTDLSPLLESALNAIRKRSLVFIISDFISLPGWDRPIQLLNQRHDLIPVRMYDPREVELPDVGVVVMEDSESGEQLYVDTRDKKFRSRFKRAAEHREEELSQTFRRAGMDALSLSTEGDLVQAILRFSLLRKRTQRQQAR
jgi:uncharacterized protein (DUF58 family)